jgi:predicted nucleic acid-binding Zn ribbon protein
MERAGDILGKALRQLDRPEAALAWLSSAWASIVGNAVAAHVRPVRCAAGCLDLAADGRAWQQQLMRMDRQIASRINQAWGATLVKEVKFSAAKPGPERLRHEFDNEYLPFIRRRA